MDQAQFRQDDYACSRDVQMAYGNNPSGMLVSGFSMYKQCMTAKGYEEAPPPLWWTRVGFDKTQFRLDESECLNEANITHWGSEEQMRRGLGFTIYHTCMVRKGYSETAPRNQ
jgi:hypothetical protein